MKTSVIEVRDMLSVLSVQGVEERIGEVPGVESVTVNFSAGNATVRYDETRLDISDIKSDVRQRGYDDDTAATPPAAPAKTTTPKPTADKPAKPDEPAPAGTDALAATNAKPPDKSTQTKAAPSTPKADVSEPAASDAGGKMPMPEKG